jgi:hypothetical protein
MDQGQFDGCLVLGSLDGRGERLTAGTTLGGTAGGWGSLGVIYCASRLGLWV